MTIANVQQRKQNFITKRNRIPFLIGVIIAAADRYMIERIVGRMDWRWCDGTAGPW